MFAELNKSQMKTSYFNREDLQKFGNITEFQEEMGKKFFAWYGEVFAEGL